MSRMVTVHLARKNVFIVCTEHTLVRVRSQ